MITMSAYPEGLSRESALMAAASAPPVLQRAYRTTTDKAVAHVGMSQALAWPLVRSLDQLVERREDAADRRAKTLHLPDAAACAAADFQTR